MRPRSINSITRRDHERRPSTTTGKFDGWLHVRRCPLHHCRKASRHRPLPLQPLPAAIRQRLLDGHFRAQQCDSSHRRDGGVRRYRGQRAQGVASPLRTLRFASHDRVPKQRPASSLSRPAPSTPTSGSALTWKCSSRDAGPGSVQSRAPRSSTPIQPFRGRPH